MGRSKKQVKLVFRKSNPGNYSIESIYNTLLTFWESEPQALANYSKIILKHNYDLFALIKYFISSLFTSKYTVHITGGCNYMVMAFPFKKRILTVHDSFQLSKKRKGNWIYKIVYYTLPVYFSNQIVAVSKAAKAQLVVYYPKAASKIVVIPNPITLPKSKHKNPQKASNPECPINILQIGAKALKNYERLIVATQSIDVRYLFVHGNTETINSLISKYKIEDRSTVYSGISNAQLAALYIKADILYFVSLDEGFGMPLLEAQSLGLPIITSNIEPMVTNAPHAVHVDPLKTDAIKNAFLSFVSNGVRPEDLIAGREFTMRFNLQDIALKYQQIYF